MIVCKVYLGSDNNLDITQYVLANPGVSCTMGIQGNKDSDRMARDGSLTFTLKNNDNRFTPGHPSGLLSWGKNSPVSVEFEKNGAKLKFKGRVDKIDLKYKYNNFTATVTVRDWLYLASKLPLDIPALQTDKRADEIISTIIGLSTVQPAAQKLGVGTTTFPYAFHDATTKTSAYTEITKAVMSEWGYGYVKGDGTFVFEPYNARTPELKKVTPYTENSGFLLMETGSYLLREDGGKFILEDYLSGGSQDADATELSDVSYPYAEDMINRAEIQVYPYKPGEEDVLVYKNEENQLIPAGESVTFRIQFTDEKSRQPIAAIQPMIKQYTLLHLDDTTQDGITGALDDADLNTKRQSGDGLYYPITPFVFVNGTKPSGKFGECFAGNGTSDYIYSPSQEKFNFGNGDFTVDWWEYRNAATANRATISRDVAGGFAPFVLGFSDGTTSRAYITSNGVSWDIANARSMGTITTGAWVHYAITRSGDTFRTFKNGVQQDTWTSSATILTSTAQLSLLRYGAVYVNGQIDEFRMIKGYAAWTADFTHAAKAYKMSGLNWSLHTQTLKDGTELTASASASISTGAAGMDFTVTNSSASDGYLSIDVYAQSLESLSSISAISEDETSILLYGVFGERIDMRLRNDIVFAKTVTDRIVLGRKDPEILLTNVFMVANKSDFNEALFMECDIGDRVKVTDTLANRTSRGSIQAISWNAIPGDGDGGAVVNFSWLLKGYL